MTARLLRRLPDGFYAWNGSYAIPKIRARAGNATNCVVGRALGCGVASPGYWAKMTRLGRELSGRESLAVWNIDVGRGRPSDARIAWRLAHQMGVL